MLVPTSYSDYFFAIAPTLNTGPSTGSLSEAAGGTGAEAQTLYPGPMDTSEAGSVRTPSRWRKLLARMRREDRESYACYVLMVNSYWILEQEGLHGGDWLYPPATQTVPYCTTDCTLLHHMCCTTHYDAFVVIRFQQ